ncbi:MAG: dihydrodipicolinate synthase family protein [Alphaproteobacteria bacterium]|nr:dihydrodipicolinate synthase family protein [Alphaproteobacteria bacterium]
MWRGVYPAVTTQFKKDFSVDFDATERGIQALIDAGVDGLIMCGTVGENGSLEPQEKRAVLKAAKEVASGKVPVVTGVAELSTEAACRYARDAEKIGVDGLMVIPPVGYSAKPRETIEHFRRVGAASGLPIMLYNNPPVYKIDVTPDMIAELASVKTIQAVKESSGDTKRLVDIQNLTGDRFILFCGLDDVLLESMLLGCVGWVSGMSNVFPEESAELFRLAAAGRWEEAMAIYRWFMPVLHLDARSDLVQCIKLCEQIAGHGHERTRPPRLPMQGAERAEIEKIMATALKNRPKLRKLKRAA